MINEEDMFIQRSTRRNMPNNLAGKLLDSLTDKSLDRPYQACRLAIFALNYDILHINRKIFERAFQ